MNIIDKKSHNELINILNELITTIELMRTEKKDYLLNQNQEEAKEWLKFLCEHTDKEEVRCCLSGTKLVLMKNGVMVVLSVKLCTFLWSLYVYSHGNAYL